MPEWLSKISTCTHECTDPTAGPLGRWPLSSHKAHHDVRRQLCAPSRFFSALPSGHVGHLGLHESIKGQNNWRLWETALTWARHVSNWAFHSQSYDLISTMNLFSWCVIMPRWLPRLNAACSLTLWDSRDGGKIQWPRLFVAILNDLIRLIDSLPSPLLSSILNRIHGAVDPCCVEIFNGTFRAPCSSDCVYITGFTNICASVHEPVNPSSSPTGWFTVDVLVTVTDLFIFKSAMRTTKITPQRYEY